MAKKEIKIRKIIMKSRREFLGLKEFLKSRGDFFWYKSSGTVNSIIYNGKEFQSVDLDISGGRGHHLNRTFKDDIHSWLEQYGDQLNPYSSDYKEQLFNLQAIEKNIGQQLVLIDINNCYWRTAHMLPEGCERGYLSHENYIKGLRKEEWKTGRNACIGSLIKSETSFPYKNGAPDYSRRIHVPAPIQYQYIRNHIIGHVYNVFFRLYEEIGDHFYMFLTDCVVTDFKNKRKVQEYLEKNGYKTKSKPIEFLRVDRNQKRIYWYDFEAKRKDLNDKVIGYGKEKYYIYSNSQLIDGVSLKSITSNSEEMSELSSNDSFLKK